MELTKENAQSFLLYLCEEMPSRKRGFASWILLWETETTV